MSKEILLQNISTTISKRSREEVFKYQALFDSNMIGVASTNFHDDILYANDAFLSIIGYTQEDIASGKLKWSTISPSSYDNADMDKMEELSAHKSLVPFEKEYIHKDGHLVPVLVGAETIDPDASFGVCFALDISQMKELEKKKDDFIGMVSHELKTPLSIMKLYSNFLETSIEEGASKEELLESASEIHNQIDKLNILITDLLNMARYQTSEGETSYPLTATDISNSVKKVVSELSLVNDRNIIFRGEKAAYINANHERLSQVIINLVNNAINYSDPSTDIVVSVHRDAQDVRIQVQDFGMGIDPENSEKIFERYYRINHADDYAERGAGLGLYVCKQIVEQHKGTISVESELGKGSIFTVKLPLIKSG